MAIQQQLALEYKYEVLWNEVQGLKRQVAGIAQTLWQISGQRGGFGGGTAPVQFRLDGGVGAGSMGSPASGTGFLLKPDGSDGEEIDVLNRSPDAMSGSRYGWVDQVGSDYYIVSISCTEE